MIEFIQILRKLQISKGSVHFSSWIHNSWILPHFVTLLATGAQIMSCGTVNRGMCTSVGFEVECIEWVRFFFQTEDFMTN